MLSGGDTAAVFGNIAAGIFPGQPIHTVSFHLLTKQPWNNKLMAPFSSCLSPVWCRWIPVRTKRAFHKHNNEVAAILSDGVLSGIYILSVLTICCHERHYARVDLLQSGAEMRPGTGCDREENDAPPPHHAAHLITRATPATAGIIINLHWATGLSGWQAKWSGRSKGWVTMSYNVALKWDSAEFNSRLRKHGELRVTLTVHS